MLSKHLISRLERIDWDFAGVLSDSAFSSIHWHPARLPAQVAATCIGLLSNPGDLVLDPFLGSGTTAIEAQRLGRHALGFDLNPVSSLIAKGKTLPIRAAKAAELTGNLKDLAVRLLSARIVSRSMIEPKPALVQTKWYTPAVLARLSELWRGISQLRGFEKLLGQMAFSAILLPVCRETRHWGYVCDNSTPKEDHEGDVVGEFCRILDRITLAYQERDESSLNLEVSRPFRARIKCADSRVAVARLPKSSIRLVLTSPPYFGVSDYVKSQRLSMEWLGIEIEPLRLLEIGARSKRHRNSALEQYLDEMKSVFAGVRPALADNGFCVIVLGESSKREPYVDAFNRSLKSCGFKIAYETSRNISVQRRQYGFIETETITIVAPR